MSCVDIRPTQIVFPLQIWHLFFLFFLKLLWRADINVTIAFSTAIISCNFTLCYSYPRPCSPLHLYTLSQVSYIHTPSLYLQSLYPHLSVFWPFICHFHPKLFETLHYIWRSKRLKRLWSSLLPILSCMRKSESDPLKGWFFMVNPVRMMSWTTECIINLFHYVSLAFNYLQTWPSSSPTSLNVILYPCTMTLLLIFPSHYYVSYHII